MRHLSLPIAEVEVIAVTRLALGIGVGLLVGDCLSRKQRRQVAWPLVALGLTSTVPLMIDVYRRRTSLGD